MYMLFHLSKITHSLLLPQLSFLINKIFINFPLTCNGLGSKVPNSTWGSHHSTPGINVDRKNTSSKLNKRILLLKTVWRETSEHWNWKHKQSFNNLIFVSSYAIHKSLSQQQLTFIYNNALLRQRLREGVCAHVHGGVWNYGIMEEKVIMSSAMKLNDYA